MKKHQYKVCDDVISVADETNARQINIDKVVSDWNIRDKKGDTDYECRVSQKLEKNGTIVVELTVTRGYMTHSQELCLALYNSYYQGLYDKKRVRFFIKEKGNWLADTEIDISRLD